MYVSEDLLHLHKYLVYDVHMVYVVYILHVKGVYTLL